MKKQKKEKSKERTLREKMASSLDAAREVILDSAKLTIIAGHELTVENYKSIVEYTDKKIVLEANPTAIQIEGEGLEIKSIARELLYITGKILSVDFKKEG